MNLPLLNMKNNNNGRERKTRKKNYIYEKINNILWKERTQYYAFNKTSGEVTYSIIMARIFASFDLFLRLIAWSVYSFVIFFSISFVSSLLHFYLLIFVHFIFVCVCVYCVDQFEMAASFCWRLIWMHKHDLMDHYSFSIFGFSFGFG